MNELLLYGALLSGIFPVIIYYFSGFEAKGALKAIFPFLWLTAFATLYEFIGTVILQWDSSIWFKLYDLLEFTAMFYFIFKLLGNAFPKGLYIFPVLFFSAYGCSLYSSFGGLKSKALLSSIMVPFILISIIIWILRVFKAKRNELLAIPEAKWMLVLAILSYYGVTYFLFLLGNFLYLNDNDSFFLYWHLNIIFTLIFRLLLGLSVWKTRSI